MNLKLSTHTNIGLLIILFSFILPVSDDLAVLIAALLIIICSLYLLKNAPILSLKNNEKYFIAIISFFIVTYIFNDFYFNLNGAKLDDPLSLFLLLPLYFYLRENKLETRHLLLSLFLGALSCFFIALYQRYSLNLSRVHGSTGIVAFGAISMSFALMSLPAFLLSTSRSIKISMAFSFVFGFSASVMSGTRGAWLALPVSLLVLLILHPFHLKKKQLIIISILVSLALVSLYFLPIIQSRIDIAYNNLDNYYNHNQIKSSLGLRLETWRISLSVINENLIFGIGEGNYKSFYQEYAKVHNTPAQIRADVSHVHNEFISAGFHRGIFGFTSLIFMFFLPMYYFIRAFKQNSTKDKLIPLTGIMLLTCFIVTSMSDVLFGQHTLTLVFAFYLYILFSQININPTVDKKINDSA